MDFIADLKRTNVSHSTRFLEIGAYDPISLSNTRALVELGWSGVYVEPAPDNAARFLKEYKNREDIVLVNAAISLKSELVKFFDSGGDALSTMSQEHMIKWNTVKFTPYFTKTITLDELFAAVGGGFSFVNLDVEGLNRDLFHALPLKDMTENGLRMLCVEHDGFVDEMRSTMIGLGYSILSYNGENLIFGR
jgi:FkbM family methyltransferase